MLIANVYGRLGRDPERKTTKAGNPMTTASLAVDVAGKDAEPTTLWVNVLAFGHAADSLRRASKGEMLAAIGRMSRGTYTGKDGTEREQWTCIAESLGVAKSARPSGAKRAGGRP